MSAIDEERPPLWKYVTKLNKDEGGGNVSFTCHHRRINYKGSYSRVKAHLLKIPNKGIKKCPKVTVEDLAEMKKLFDDAETRAKDSKPKQVSLPNSRSHALMDFSSSTSFDVHSKKRKGTIQNAFNNDAREDMNRLIGRMFYSAELPFNFAKNPHFIEVLRRATANSKTLSGYIPPGYNQLRTTLLQEEKNHIGKLLDPIKSTWKHNGVTIVSYGWTDFQRRPIINFIAVCESGPMFLKAINCQGEYKDKVFIANLLKETINEVGADNVVQVITDNAPVCKSAGLLIETHFPHIFWTPCVFHTLNLALKNICAAKNTEANAETFAECSWISDIISDAVFVRKFIMTHPMRLTMFNDHNKLKLLTVADTRFASSVIMIQRFVHIKEGL
ncbi:uncharacterized protein LOC113272962 [Papaver somniferum]|uniref:uncharacterized protein LOC113272962 n=1 Tax=Papaver somniferum TaxID=3469 RepID=UPI000E6F5855|nr:uncharacterized protein LOC113272962 [Papaver somniferum]